MVTSSVEPGRDRKAVEQRASEIETCLGVEGIELTAPHGVYDDEANRGNRFRIDVHVKGPWSEALASDDLRQTLDYDRVVRSIHSVSRRRRYHLIESLAGAIAADVLAGTPGVTEVRVCVKKLSLPDWGEGACATATVTVRPK